MGARLSRVRGNVDVEVGGEIEEREQTSGTNVFSLLILMAEGSSKELWQMFANELSCEARKGGEMATTNGTQ